MEYISAQQAADKWGISKRRVQVLCSENRIADATRIGNMWVVPFDAKKPADARVQAQHPHRRLTERRARGALKKLTETSFEKINNKLQNPHKSKMVFIAFLATVQFENVKHNQEDTDISEDFLLICKDVIRTNITPCNVSELFNTFSFLIPLFRKFTEQYSEYMEDSLSWAYQYVNKLSRDSGLENTQFFTEKYMIDYLTKDISSDISHSNTFLDPACGGGNFLSHILDKLYRSNSIQTNTPSEHINNILSILFGYELDPQLAVVATVNLKLKALSLLSLNQIIVSSDWEIFCPNIYTSVTQSDFGFLEEDFQKHMVYRVSDCQEKTLSQLVEPIFSIYTNPPFQTVKGMAAHLKNHLKKFFPDAKCDLCNAFILQCLSKIRNGGTIGLVTQSSWMYLDSFENLRYNIIQNTTIEALADLGSGAFYDLSGEKANVALLKAKATKYQRNQPQVKVHSLRDVPLNDKVSALSKLCSADFLLDQTTLFGGKHLAFSPHGVNHIITGKYGDFGTPMQGTSTGNASELISYYWEHLEDPEWVAVSKGGGYSRWCGLNNYVLKWGQDGEYIRATPGSALRNTKYFSRTSLVYSDTGTSGFNARLIEAEQLFVASGPGIRDIVGNPFAHLALLNSRLFSYYLHSLSPKLTVAAGYISRVPVPETLLDAPEMEKLGKKCYGLKHKFLTHRPNNIEWSAPTVSDQSIKNFAIRLFQEEMSDEYEKLIHEEALDKIILAAYSLTKEEVGLLNSTLGVPAAGLAGMPNINTIDATMAESMDVNCQLSRTRASRKSIGCDGLLEFVSRKESISPNEIVTLLMSNPELFSQCINKYTEMCLHNIVLSILEFRKHQGFIFDTNRLKESFAERYPSLIHEWEKIEEWVQQRFNTIHTQSFCSRPYYHYENGVIKLLY